ncbi:serine hydrolase domain-containing protein [Paenibacillus caui]|uniref:serine hydrolase domain-containing protein n=1 Tax=Paenibacillus caui TaxID=2873927 RepID=UPI001CA8347B|nr:serine hydrolase domain-containing protein [Paenibacillus caui]
MEKSEVSAKLQNIEKIIEQTMQSWKTPGVAVAVVHKEGLVYCSGFGYRDKAEQLPVDTETVFAIGSSTKPFITTVLAMLVNEGKMKWDTPIKQYVPDFRMHDEAATKQLTFRDIACHRSGMPSHQFMFVEANMTAGEWILCLPDLEPNLPFRYAFQYSNLMFAQAGYLIERITGTPWEEWVRELIAKPIGMAQSNFSVAETTAGSNYAKPYAVAENDILEIPFTKDQPGSARAMNASIADMAAWVSFQLHKGAVQAAAVAFVSGL